MGEYSKLSQYEKMALGKFNVDYEQRVDMQKLREEKWERAKKALSDDNIAIVVTWNADNCRYLCSAYLTTPNRAGEYQYCSYTKNGLATFYGGCPEESNRRMPWMKGRVFDAFGSALKAGVYTNDAPAVQRYIKNTLDNLADAGLKAATCDPTTGKVIAENDGYIGIEGTSMLHVWLSAFQAAGYKAVWAVKTMDKARAVKTTEEIKIMRQVAANTEFAFTAIADAIRPGIKECDLVGIGLKALYENGIDHNEDLVCMSGENTNPYNWTFTDKQVRPGDPVYIDVDAASYLGYKSCVYRTFYCGRPTDDQRRTYDAALEMLRGGIDACNKPGVTNFDLFEGFKLSTEVRKAAWGTGDWAGHDPWALAHGCGLSLHDRPFVAHSYYENGGEEIPLEPGMVLAIETFAGLPDHRTGARLEDMVLITDEGCEIISRFPIDEPLICWRDWAANTRGILM